MNIANYACFLGTLVLAAGLSARPAPQSDPASKEPTSIVITFKDGHQETFPMADIARVEYRDEVDSSLGQDYFLGEWAVGDGNSGTFLITFKPNGEATRSLGASHGIWAIAGDEARIRWDDGWCDVIRKIGDAHEKFAFAPGTTLDDQPANVTAAWKLKQKKAEPKS